MKDWILPILSAVGFLGVVTFCGAIFVFTVWLLEPKSDENSPHYETILDIAKQFDLSILDDTDLRMAAHFCVYEGYENPYIPDELSKNEARQLNKRLKRSMALGRHVGEHNGLVAIRDEDENWIFIRLANKIVPAKTNLQRGCHKRRPNKAWGDTEVRRR